eukprot:CAMPEP_0168618270 /NCGR_PEP_ID=MMETSP0449_2-20121227/5985_1 /TAXON_ID=1082188 /ORGANISM="Strombidium rassoulzadegani, Strain ras09" /LENGTH=94 /DNA_ID=CAMNT_0008659139 /DNA_START=773 /DNA_END=1057 /DNA_ORIENTATION=-
MPKQIDTLAFSEPNKRYYRYLKIWDPKKGGKGGKKLDWDQHMKNGRAKGFVQFDKQKYEAGQKRVKALNDAWKKSSAYRTAVAAVKRDKAKSDL